MERRSLTGVRSVRELAEDAVDVALPALGHHFRPGDRVLHMERQQLVGRPQPVILDQGVGAAGIFGVEHLGEGDIFRRGMRPAGFEIGVPVREIVQALDPPLAIVTLDVGVLVQATFPPLAGLQVRGIAFIVLVATGLHGGTAAQAGGLAIDRHCPAGDWHDTSKRHRKLVAAGIGKTCDPEDLAGMESERNSLNILGAQVLMLVIVILGIIASMVVPNLIGNQEQAARQKAVVDIQQLESALDMYRLRNGFYPNTEQGMQALVTAPTSQPVPRAFPDGGFIRRLPKDPWDEDYILISPGQVELMIVSPTMLRG